MTYLEFLLFNLISSITICKTRISLYYATANQALCNIYNKCQSRHQFLICVLFYFFFFFTSSEVISFNCGFTWHLCFFNGSQQTLNQCGYFPNNNDGNGTINYFYQDYQDLLDTLSLPILPKKGRQDQQIMSSSTKLR